MSQLQGTFPHGRVEPYRSHPLYPVLQYMSKTLQQIDGRTAKLEKDVCKVKQLQEELRSLFEEQNRKQLNVKMLV